MIQSKIHLLGIFCLACMGALSFPVQAMAATVPKSWTFANDSLPYKAWWGPYTITVVSLGDESGQRLRIQDNTGRVLREVRAPDILDVDFPVLQFGHLPALRVLVSQGGVAESSERTYLFSCECGVRSLLVFTGEIMQIRHSAGGMMADLIADSSVPLEYFTGFSHYGCGNVILVLGWSGNRYVLANRRCSWLARVQAQAYRRKLVVAISSDRRDPEQVGAALGSCANLWTIGEGSSCYRWLRGQMTRAGWRWFLRAQPELRRRMTRLPHQITVSQQHTFVMS